MRTAIFPFHKLCSSTQHSDSDPVLDAIPMNATIRSLRTRWNSKAIVRMSALLLASAAAAFMPSAAPLNLVSAPRVHPMTMVESVDVERAGDAVLDDLLIENASGGMRRKMAEGLRQKQIAITDLVSAADGMSFDEDAWTRPKGGGGITRSRRRQRLEKLRRGT